MDKDKVEFFKKITLIDRKGNFFCEIKLEESLQLGEDWSIDTFLDKLKKNTSKIIFTTLRPRLSEDEFKKLVEKVCQKQK